MSVPFNSKAPETLEDDSDFQIRTPLGGSHGYVVYVNDDDETFYGCGETGCIWRKKENLFRDIKLIIERYSHRKLCYIETEFGWVSNSDEPENMDELIDQEEDEELDEYERD